MKNLWLMTGVPGSGKSTYLKRLPMTDNDKLVSRDTIRFGIVKDDEEYFSHEDEVFAEFINKIQSFINDDTTINIYIDATHLTEKSRNKVLNNLKLDRVDTINCINMITPLSVCLEYNEQREGRAYVPKSVIKRMSHTYQPATNNEEYRYNQIVNIF